jgi:hypothetical protein
MGGHNPCKRLKDSSAWNQMQNKIGFLPTFHPVQCCGRPHVLIFIGDDYENMISWLLQLGPVHNSRYAAPAPAESGHAALNVAAAVRVNKSGEPHVDWRL